MIGYILWTNFRKENEVKQRDNWEEEKQRLISQFTPINYEKIYLKRRELWTLKQIDSFEKYAKGFQFIVNQLFLLFFSFYLFLSKYL